MDRVHAVEKNVVGIIIAFIKKYYYVGILFTLLIFFRKSILFAFLIVLLMGFAILSTLSSKMIQFNLGIELITFATVVLAFAYTPIVALFAAVLMVFCASFLQGRLLCPYNLSRYGIYVVLCLMVLMFSGLGVNTAGKILTLVYNALLGLAYSITGFGLVKGIIPISINIFLNFFLFSTFAQPLVDVLVQGL